MVMEYEDIYNCQG